MSAISLSSFNSFRPTQGAALPSTQQSPRAAFGSTAPTRGGNVGAAGNSSAYCPTCVGGGGRGESASSSYCPTCNRAGGAQSNVAGGNARFGAAQGGTNFASNNNAPRFGAAQTGAAGGAHNHGGGRVCVGCAYQAR